MAIEAYQIEKIVEEVMKKMVSGGSGDSFAGKAKGIFESVDEAVKAAKAAQKELVAMRIEKREMLLKAMREAAIAHAEELARLAVEETGMGRVTDKIIKNRVAAEKTPGTENLQPSAVTGDRGLTLIERAPYGVIGAITPSTNPCATVINNSISMVAAGNSVVFSVHPGAKKASLLTVEILNEAIEKAGGPANVLTAVASPSLENTNALMKHPDIKLLVATGGPGLVKAVLSSGKKAIGAGAGNPPALVDETADLERAAKSIVAGASFDNNLPCIAEKEVIVVDYVANQLISYMKQNGAYLANDREIKALMDLVLTKNENLKAEGCTVKPEKLYGGINKEYVGKDAAYIMKKIGVDIPEDTKLIICEVDEDHPFVLEELMMPILPIVRVPNVQKAIEVGVRVEHGNRHTAVMHSQNIDNLSAFARAIQTTIFVKNGPSYAGIGIGGEGYTTFTIAGPTGEGLTAASSFTRQRRCVLVDGFSIV
ncbi:Aldehyde Dehydrogenase [Thermincola ferriacetica]|uniref:Aldehyde Dehydrogenase n=1 Tax=Thermincola ferriacetica TaxID=281456 RepID=A0A0L6W1L7_9FIRM|nr:aldehyde dehydrogenase family protein [Thermincola ferriacetica]KNZ68964.1 Aldehyde Dehydrogenase [Thermincola ferriacetica]